MRTNDSRHGAGDDVGRGRLRRGFRRGPGSAGRGRGDEAKKDATARRRRAARGRRIRPYDRVITKEAKTSAGLFLVHRLDDKVFFEIPTEELGKEMLWVTQLEQTQAGHSYGASRWATGSCAGSSAGRTSCCAT